MDVPEGVAVTFEEVSAASFRIREGINRTPCDRSHMSALTGMEIFFKKEYQQFTGSFKERGARNTFMLLTQEQRRAGVIAASAGNHALSLAYHGRDLNVPVTVIMPLTAPLMKVSLCRHYEANVIQRGNDFGEAKAYAMAMSEEKGLQYINGYDDVPILAGQGTMGLEIIEQVPDLDAIVIPVGGGGLLAGTALAIKSLKPHVQVISVESDKCPSWQAAMDAGHPVATPVGPTLADGLAVPTVGYNAFKTAQKLVDKHIVISEDKIALAILRLIEMEKAVVEGAGATALAALLGGDLDELKGKKVVVPLCGGNIDTTVLGRCLERGLAADGRLIKFVVRVDDRPNGVAELTRIIGGLGVSIKDIFHERAWVRSDIFNVDIKCVCETRDFAHSNELRLALEKSYPNRVDWSSQIHT
ncbi:L-threonine ammonia-lyase-like [Sycon ciliatum]|uniref:L-threonine ammonia-lyase-like n=1 Tax=Sycon ciliatum TaxID=27933 RepID=UPI0020AB16E8|eukprot:scpid65102/ scgid22984/ L-threonine dehydratase catabolic TdcB; Threonine deaminase &gt; L-threonine dehydratase catabolic TdcB; Threonine deaminase &gt; L-threonine dehydratase catabolic TdcB; Threonine deaminase &gt; L-threonine dehydratase catabolic TdcB; Threonine deaminase &gt; L-threonine dehydratase catabolic TdcB; Threonine deaminase &gt; L-threonine dehydratase catabolic TdcB; Threonine deaminase